MLENKEFVEKTGLTGGLKGKTFVIEVNIYYLLKTFLINSLFNKIFQGFGSVGYWAAHHLQQAGAILVGVCEHDAQIYNPNGKQIKLQILASINC